MLTKAENLYNELHSSTNKPLFGSGLRSAELKLLNYVHTGKVLVVGCGDGMTDAIPLAKEGFKVTGVDISSKAIEKAMSLSASGLHIKFILGDITKMNIRSLFNVITMDFLLHIMKEDEKLKVLSITMKHTKRGGFNLITFFTHTDKFDVYKTKSMESYIDLFYLDNSLKVKFFSGELKIRMLKGSMATFRYIITNKI